ncbi:MAG: hypothetical protein ABSF44_13855, partial [Candidatus Bathyarchaeia archaeon]
NPLFFTPFASRLTAFDSASTARVGTPFTESAKLPDVNIDRQSTIVTWLLVLFALLGILFASEKAKNLAVEQTGYLRT